jgi:hypothetical protein
MPARQQPDLPFFVSSSGYDKWQEELAAFRAELEHKLGIPIGATVRLTLRDFEHPFTGVLELVVGTHQSNPRLRLRDLRFDFGIDEITSLQKLADP